MSNRIKPASEAVTNIRQVEGCLAEMAAIERKLGAISAQMNEDIDAVKKRAEQAAVSLNARFKELGEAIKVYATLNQDTLFKDKKSLDLAFGVIGFQASTEIIQLPKIDAETTLERLESFGYADGINVKKSILKTAMSNWTDSKLQSVGLKRRKKNAFYIEIKAEALSQ